jgi:hypothetical protein
MDPVTGAAAPELAPFNGAVEIGLRTLCILVAAFPVAQSVQRLTALDYFIVHSDDVPGGPEGLHPQTPYRSGEILARRGIVQEGVLLYESRGLIERQYTPDGLFYTATDRAAGFLDALSATYVDDLRDRATWAADALAVRDDADLAEFVRDHVGEWGAEFTMQSVLWEEDER